MRSVDIRANIEVETSESHVLVAKLISNSENVLQASRAPGVLSLVFLQAACVNMRCTDVQYSYISDH